MQSYFKTDNEGNVIEEEIIKHPEMEEKCEFDLGDDVEFISDCRIKGADNIFTVKTILSSSKVFLSFGRFTQEHYFTCDVRYLQKVDK